MADFADLREYLDALDELGDLRRISQPVDPYLEAAAVMRLAYERQGAPAVLCEDVTGVEAGFRLLGCPASLSSIPDRPWARVALSMGLPATAGLTDIVEHVVGARTLPPLPPVEVAPEKATCKQNILRGSEATLSRFPIPMIHQQDGGRYVNSWGIVVTATPDGRWTNWAITRVMQVGDRLMTGAVLPGQHIAKVWQEWVDLGQPMPYALVQGGPPIVPVVGALPVPEGVDEAGAAGAMLGKPLEVVRCETVDLLVPAQAEVVIEGHIGIDRTQPEGPFGEFNGYIEESDTPGCQPEWSIEAITYRDDPIWPLIAEGRPSDEGHTLGIAAYLGEVLAGLRGAGLPITTAQFPMLTAMHWLVITVPRDWRNRLPDVDSAEFTRRICDALDTMGRVGRIAAQVFVLDDDIDPTDTRDLLWAVATRVHPADRVEYRPGPIFPGIVAFTREERAVLRGTIAVHNGLQESGTGTVHSSFSQAYPADVQERAIKLWNS